MTRPDPRISANLPPAIVLGADTPIGLTVIRELGRRGVAVHAIGRSPQAIGRASRHAARFSVRPEAPLAEWLPELIAGDPGRALFAVGEGDLLALSALPPVIGACRILTPRSEPLAAVLDKRRTLELAGRAGIDTPSTWQPLEGEDFARRAATLAFPVVLKWGDPQAVLAPLTERGLVLEKAEHAGSAAELLQCLDRYRPMGVYPMVQTWVSGFGLGQMLLMTGGAARLRFQHRRLREFPASGGVSSLCAAVPAAAHAGQMAKSEALLAAIGWEGPAMVEYRHDPETGRYWLMEVNGRLWGSLPLASQAGAEFAWEHYRAAILGDHAPMVSGYRNRRARYVVPDTKRLVQVLRDPAGAAAGRPRFSRCREALAWLGEFLNPATGYYVWSWSDPGPLLGDLAAIFRKVLRRESGS